MRIYDCRTKAPSTEADAIARRTSIVLAEDYTCQFYDGTGNQTATWPQLEVLLFRSLPGGFHSSLSDVSVGPQQDVEIRIARDDPDAAAWFCRQLIDRGVVPESAPVTAVFEDGEEYLGPAGKVMDSRLIPVASYAT